MAGTKDPHNDKVDAVTEELRSDQAQIAGRNIVRQLKAFGHITLTEAQLREATETGHVKILNIGLEEGSGQKER